MFRFLSLQEDNFTLNFQRSMGIWIPDFYGFECSKLVRMWNGGWYIRAQIAAHRQANFYLPRQAAAPQHLVYWGHSSHSHSSCTQVAVHKNLFLMYCGGRSTRERLFLVYCGTLWTAVAAVGVNAPQFKSFHTVPWNGPDFEGWNTMADFQNIRLKRVWYWYLHLFIHPAFKWLLPFTHQNSKSLDFGHSLFGSSRYLMFY